MFVSSWRSSRVRLSSSVWTYTAAYNIIFLSPSSIGSLSLSLVFYHFIYLFQSGTKESWRHVDARPGKKNSPPLVARPRRRREKRLAVSYFIPIDHPNRAVPIRARPACEISEDSLSLSFFLLLSFHLPLLLVHSTLLNWTSRVDSAGATELSAVGAPGPLHYIVSFGPEE